MQKNDLCIGLRIKLNVNISPQVWLMIAANLKFQKREREREGGSKTSTSCSQHICLTGRLQWRGGGGGSRFYLELQHLAHTPELWQDVVVELDEILLQLLLAVLQTRVDVVVVAARLLHAERCEHPAYHQRRGGCGVNVLARTPGRTRQTTQAIVADSSSLQTDYYCKSQTVPVTKSTRASLKEERAVGYILFCSIVLWILCHWSLGIHPGTVLELERTTSTKTQFSLLLHYK